jgi:hypothetical protein
MTSKKRNRRHELLRFISKRALAGYERLPIGERANLFEGLSIILPKPEAELAQRTAFHLRQAQEQQQRIEQLLGTNSDGTVKV